MLKYKIPQIVTLIPEKVTETVSVFFVVPWYKQ